MTDKFDTATLDALRSTMEIRIIPSGHRGAGIIIWAVAVGDEAFVRSVKGANARWYKSVAADGRATLAIGDRRIAVRASPVSVPAAIERVSREYLTKYRDSEYAPAMVRPEVLDTTLLLEPA
ncbi:MAG: DUF2255 family protein [Acetobacteraceae bacterium]